MPLRRACTHGSLCELTQFGYAKTCRALRVLVAKWEKQIKPDVLPLDLRARHSLGNGTFIVFHALAHERYTVGEVRAYRFRREGKKFAATWRRGV